MVMVKEQMFKDHIQSIRPYQPGKPIKEVERELGLRHVVKLASNENALGASRKALRAMRKALRDVHLYPDGSGFYLTEKLATDLGVSEKQVILGNGSNEIIELLFRGFLSEGDEVISSETSFLVYPILTQACGAKFVSVPMKDNRYDLRALADAVTERTKLIFIANPNNPTGTYVTREEVEEFISRVPQNVIICFDEAYIDFVDAADFPYSLSSVKTGRKNVMIMRTFSKSFGLAGLRIGYGIGHEEIVQYLHKIRQPFNVNAIAQAGAVAALDDKFFLWRTKKMVAKGKKYFYKEFDRLGLTYLPSQANFVLVDTGIPADDISGQLLKRGVIVRSMTAYGLTNWIRVTIGKRGENSLFMKHLKSILKQQKSQ